MGLWSYRLIPHCWGILSSGPLNSWSIFTRNQQPKEETDYGITRFITRLSQWKKHPIGRSKSADRSSRRSPRAERRSARSGQQICAKRPGERIPVVGGHG